MTTETVQFTELVRETYSRPRVFHLYYCAVCGNDTIHRFVRDERSTGRELWRCSVCGIGREVRT